jgi:hypothetical protein
MVTSAPDDLSGRVPTRSDLTAAVDLARKCLKLLDFKLIGALASWSGSWWGRGSSRAWMETIFRKRGVAIAATEIAGA